MDKNDTAIYVTLAIFAGIVIGCLPFAGGRQYLKEWWGFVWRWWVVVCIGAVVVGAVAASLHAPRT